MKARNFSLVVQACKPGCYSYAAFWPELNNCIPVIY